MSKMRSSTNYIVFPEGDTQTIPHGLQVNQVVDVNGYPLPLPLPRPKMLAYRVFRKSTREDRNETGTYFYLEQIRITEMGEYT